MPSISIVSPWAGDTANGPNSLLPDYYVAIQGAHVVTVDNACDHVTATNLTAMHEQIGGEYIRNSANRGFAAANNQGYARATGDIIIFLNSDIAADPRWLQAVAADVRDDALYGPSLQHQLVYGMWLPYLEGWCVAGTRATWERVIAPAKYRRPLPRGPWDADHYPGPYWEDNDLCLRALQADIQLIQTAWPIQHKGGRTAGPILRHGDSFERNRATFAARVREVWAKKVEVERWK